MILTSKFNNIFLKSFFLRGFLFAIIFFSGFKFHALGYKWYNLTLILFVFFLYVIAAPYFKVLAHRSIVSLERKLQVIEISIDSRLFQWKKIYQFLQSFHGSDLSKWDELQASNVLYTRGGTSSIVKMLAKSFYSDINERMHNVLNLSIKVAYLQINNKNNDCLEIRHKENFVCLGLKQCELNDYLTQKFYKNDGSSAGLAWHLKKPIFISDTDKEITSGVEPQRYTKFNYDKDTKSLVCIPVFSNNRFYGTLCITCSVKGIIRENQSFKNTFIKSITPIIKHLILIETIKEVNNIYWERFSEMVE